MAKGKKTGVDDGTKLDLEALDSVVGGIGLPVKPTVHQDSLQQFEAAVAHAVSQAIGAQQAADHFGNRPEQTPGQTDPNGAKALGMEIEAVLTPVLKTENISGMTSAQSRSVAFAEAFELLNTATKDSTHLVGDHHAEILQGAQLMAAGGDQAGVQKINQQVHDLVQQGASGAVGLAQDLVTKGLMPLQTLTDLAHSGASGAMAALADLATHKTVVDSQGHNAALVAIETLVQQNAPGAITQAESLVNSGVMPLNDVTTMAEQNCAGACTILGDLAMAGSVRDAHGHDLALQAVESLVRHNVPSAIATAETLVEHGTMPFSFVTASAHAGNIGALNLLGDLAAHHYTGASAALQTEVLAGTSGAVATLAHHLTAGSDFAVHVVENVYEAALSGHKAASAAVKSLLAGDCAGVAEALGDLVTKGVKGAAEAFESLLVNVPGAAPQAAALVEAGTLTTQQFLNLALTHAHATGAVAVLAELAANPKFNAEALNNLHALALSSSGDFTDAQNAIAALAHNGVTGAQAMVDEFAHLRSADISNIVAQVNTAYVADFNNHSPGAVQDVVNKIMGQVNTSTIHGTLIDANTVKGIILAELYQVSSGANPLAANPVRSSFNPADWSNHTVTDASLAKAITQVDPANFIKGFAALTADQATSLQAYQQGLSNAAAATLVAAGANAPAVLSQMETGLEKGLQLAEGTRSGKAILGVIDNPTSVQAWENAIGTLAAEKVGGTGKLELFLKIVETSAVTNAMSAVLGSQFTAAFQQTAHATSALINSLMTDFAGQFVHGGIIGMNGGVDLAINLGNLSHALLSGNPSDMKDAATKLANDFVNDIKSNLNSTVADLKNAGAAVVTFLDNVGALSVACNCSDIVANGVKDIANTIAHDMTKGSDEAIAGAKFLVSLAVHNVPGAVDAVAHAVTNGVKDVENALVNEVNNLKNLAENGADWAKHAIENFASAGISYADTALHEIEDFFESLWSKLNPTHW